MADTVVVSKSSVSRQLIEASEAEVETLLGRRFDELKLVVLYIDGVVFGDHVMIGAVGVDAEGHKHVLEVRPAVCLALECQDGFAAEAGGKAGNARRRISASKSDSGHRTFRTNHLP